MSLPIERDVQTLRKVESLLCNPDSLRLWSDKEIDALFQILVGRLNRVRMGGRSASLIALCVLLWNRQSTLFRFDVEALLALSLRIPADRSFVFPEWGIVLTGALVARFSEQLPADEKPETLGQIRLLLKDFESNGQATNAVRDAAHALLEVWDAGFPNGLNPVIHACRQGWPDTSRVREISVDTLKEITGKMNASLPAWLTERDRSMYRLYLERQGEWQVLERLNFA